MVHFKRSLAAPLVASGALLVGLVPASAASPPYQHVGTVTEPNISLLDGFGSFDISWVDARRDRYFLADRAGTDSTGTFVRGRIDTADADDGSFIGYLGAGQFAGNYNSPASPAGGNAPPAGTGCAESPRDPRNGPNGVLTDDNGIVWVGDGNINTGPCDPTSHMMPTSNSHIDWIDPADPDTVHQLDNGGKRRADEGAFGKIDGQGRLLIGNPEEDDANTAATQFFPFETLVNTDSKSIIGKVVYDQVPPANTDPTQVPAVGHGWNASGFGLEQDVYDQDDHVFLLNVPGTALNKGGEIDVISPRADKDGEGQILKIFPLANCGGSGLALGEGKRLAVQCSGDVRVLDEETGRQIAVFPAGGGADEIWFNPGDGNVYQGITAASGGGLGILDLRSLIYLGVVVANPIGTVGSHSVAADSKTNRIFLPGAEAATVSAGPPAVTKPGGNGGIIMYQKDDREP